jgi:hypothetical protein
MGDFEFYLAFIGLLLGLAMAQLLSRLADVIGARNQIRVGWLSPLLATALMLGILSTWVNMWDERSTVAINSSLIYFIGINVSAFFLAVSMVFPRNVEEWPTLDDHYWQNKRWVIGISGATSALTVIFFSAFSRQDPSSVFRWSVIDCLWEGLFFGPLVVLMVSRSRRIDLAALATFIIQYLIAATGFVPL